MIEFVKVIGAGMVGAIVGTLMTKSSNNKKYNKIVDDCVDVCITAYIVCGVSIVDLKSHTYMISFQLIVGTQSTGYSKMLWIK